MLPVEQPRCAVAVLLAERGPDRSVASELPWGNVVAIGSVDERLVIAHMTADITGILGFDAEELIGTSLLQLVVPVEVPHLLELITWVTAADAGMAKTIRARLRSGGQAQCEIVLVPNAPDGA